VCFDRAADIYDASRRPARPEVIEALAEELSDCSSVLDIGVGTGRFAVPLLERGFRVVGIDLSRKMLDLGRAKGATNVVLGDMRRLPFRLKSFDAVLAVHVLHLVDDLAGVLAQATATARKKLVSIMNTYDPPAQGVTHAYRQAIRGRGLKTARRREDAELRLAEVIRPRRFETAVKYEEREDADAALAALRNRLWTMTWDVPDDVHDAVLEDLTRRLGGTRKVFTCKVCLLSWDVADFTASALKRVGD
jgi:SAM-dependent methyltransferase